jgi:hypothetical protein
MSQNGDDRALYSVSVWRDGIELGRMTILAYDEDDAISEAASTLDHRYGTNIHDPSDNPEYRAEKV